jgi:D-tagatose-1,6-bisphosphate aldolase subunit GatZ/KbaZ
MIENLTVLAARRSRGERSGIYSVCSAHPLVIEAAARQALADDTPLLVEATSNQVDQFGGYTGMRPRDFTRFVREVTAGVGLPEDRLIFGGDHLGPNPWRRKPAAQAMQLATDLLAAYAAAGMTKLHLDASMRCADDPEVLTDEVVAQRAAVLCAAAEAAAIATKPVYVIGTEVPVPGGAAESLSTVEVTRSDAARRTIAVHREAFEVAGLGDAWSRVVAVVVQPGVEFDHDRVVDYRPACATELTAVLDEHEQFVFEAHSTDYQRPDALAALVSDGFAILKVGPGLSFAMREALFALAAIEDELVRPGELSLLRQVVERRMCEQPAQWQDYYHGTPQMQRLLRTYSYSDRVRYYWSDPDIAAATDKLMHNLEHIEIPESIISQYLPDQYRAIRLGLIERGPRALAIDRIRDALRPYAAACRS